MGVGGGARGGRQRDGERGARKGSGGNRRGVIGIGDGGGVGHGRAAGAGCLGSDVGGQGYHGRRRVYHGDGEGPVRRVAMRVGGGARDGRRSNRERGARNGSAGKRRGVIGIGGADGVGHGCAAGAGGLGGDVGRQAQSGSCLVFDRDGGGARALVAGAVRGGAGDGRAPHREGGTRGRRADRRQRARHRVGRGGREGDHGRSAPSTPPGWAQ